LSISDSRLAIVGATGLVGENLLRILEERGHKPRLTLFASERSQGKKIAFAGMEQSVIALTRDKIGDYDFAVFAAGGKISREYAPIFAQKGCVVIDKSSAWRADPQCPLVIPQINAHALTNIPRGIIASPNCSTTGLVLVLKPLIDAFGVPEHIVVATFQSVSGAGRAASEALLRQRDSDSSPAPFPAMIHDNIIPAIGEIDETLFYTEETKLSEESRKILEIEELQISGTAVRVPVEIGHSEAVTILWKNDISLEGAIEELRKAPTIEISELPMPSNCAGRDSVIVGRIRKTPKTSGVLNLFLCFDNLRRGAATNAVDILEAIAEC